MVKRKLLCILLFLTAFVFAGSAMAATSVSWLTPPANSHYAVGTAVTLTGNASGQGASGGTGLDLVLVMDDSGSMAYYGYVDDQQNAAKALVAALPQATSSVAIVQFGSSANVVQGLTQLDGTNTAINAAIMTVNGDQGSTSIHGGINAAAPLLTANSRLQAMVVMSDGESSVTLADDAADAAVLAGVEAIHSVGMGANSGTAALQAVVNGDDDIYGNGDDYGTYKLASNIADLVGLFSGTSGNLVGLDHIDITDPDSVIHSSWATDGFGNFNYGWTLALGANIFKVEAFGDDGSSATAYITLYGDNGTPAVPEPATMALFGLGLISLAGISRRKK